MATPLVLLYELAWRQARRLAVAVERQPAAVPDLLARLGHTLAVIGGNAVRMGPAERGVTEQIRATLAHAPTRPVTREQVAAVCRLLDGLRADADGLAEEGEAWEEMPIT